MNFIASGIQETGRKLHRFSDRRHLKREQLLLDQAEIFLGQLGWQQVDFPPEIERQIHAINEVERKQAQISNQGAGIQGSIDQLQEQHEQFRSMHTDALSELEGQLQPMLESRDELKKPLGAWQQGVDRFEKAIADLEEKFHSSGPLLEQLKSIRPQTLLVKQQIIQIEDMKIGFDAEREDLQIARRKLINNIKGANEQIGKLEAKIKELKQQIAEAKGEFSDKEREARMMIDSLEHDKQASRTTVDSLDQKKAPAYLAIGRCLADAHLGPRNQPEALDHVLALRESVHSYHQRIAKSLEASSKVGGGAMAAFYIFVILLIAAIAIVIFMFVAPAMHAR